MKGSQIESVLNKITGKVNPVMEKILTSYIDKENQEIVKYQVLTGGKRLRPALAVISCKLLGGKLKDALYPAAGLEILHNYSLIVDDIIDNSSLRRGKPTVWTKFGKSIAECIGIDYSAAIFQAANLSKEPIKISRLFSKTIKTVADGEILDILFEQYGREEEPYVVRNRYQSITEKEYFKMASRKTASLFQTCCEAGGVVASAKEKELEALRNYGFNLGIAFQVRDDILDIFGEEKTFGKKIGKDITERKGGNVVVLSALKRLPRREKERVLEIMKKGKIKNKDVREAIKLISQTNSYQKSLQFGQKFIDKAKENLSFLPQNKWTNLLEEIADFVMGREV